MGILEYKKRAEDSQISIEKEKTETHGEEKIDEAFESDDPAKAVTDLVRGKSKLEL